MIGAWRKVRRIAPLVALGLAPCAMPASAQAHKLLEACHRGKLEVCHEMLARPRLAAGTRAAIELFLDEIDVQQKACASGDAIACQSLERENPDLPKR